MDKKNTGGRPPTAMHNDMTRAQKVICALGGNYAVSRLLGLSPSVIFRWKNHNGGSVPRQHVERLKEAAKVAGVVIDVEWLE